MKSCVLKDGPCTGCGECDRCDINPDKICDNCAACIQTPDMDYAEIPVVMPDQASRPAIASRPRKARKR